jgi:hypothetical protein
MKLRYVLPLLVCTASLAAPVTGPLGDGRAKPVKLSMNDASAAGAIGCDAINPLCIYFFVTTSEGQDGRRSGSVSVGNLYQSSGPSMVCSGEAYADALKYDEKTLRFTINVTLDPIKDPTCISDSQGAIVVNISGAPSGTSTDSSSGTGVITTLTSKTQYKFEHDTADAIATGTNGYVNGTFPGFFAANRRTDKTKVN